MGTDLGTSRDSPALGGVYKLVADMPEPGEWRPVVKRSPAKATVPGAKQVFRTYRDGEMAGDLVAATDERPEGDPLLVPVMRAGRRVDAESLEELRARAAAQLGSLPQWASARVRGRGVAQGALPPQSVGEVSACGS